MDVSLFVSRRYMWCSIPSLFNIRNDRKISSKKPEILYLWLSKKSDYREANWPKKFGNVVDTLLGGKYFSIAYVGIRVR